MTDSASEAAPTLNDLIQTCKDGEHGYQSAALLVDDLNLRHLFQSYAQQRAEFAAELQLEVQRLGSDPVESGHASAALHRAWMGIKEGVAGGDEGSIISECERGEDLAVRQYRDTIDAGLPGDLRSIVERQYLQVKEAHDHVRSLERAHGRHV
ncbi:MAG TPA: PA2169 family four-helix-bundle protein [Gemmatimonadales bacterium]|nr:PA2169 family four-helix-bundle protein [Gemmatimonadales bacterium]